MSVVLNSTAFEPPGCLRNTHSLKSQFEPDSASDMRGARLNLNVRKTTTSTTSTYRVLRGTHSYRDAPRYAESALGRHRAPAASGGGFHLFLSFQRTETPAGAPRGPAGPSIGNGEWAFPGVGGWVFRGRRPSRPGRGHNRNAATRARPKLRSVPGPRRAPTRFTPLHPAPPR